MSGLPTAGFQRPSTPISTVGVLVYTPTNNARGSFPLRSLVISLEGSHSSGVRWHLSVGLICIFPLARDGAQFFHAFAGANLLNTIELYT